MPEPEARSDAYEAAREGALAWLTAHWDPGVTVREWWARLAESTPSGGRISERKASSISDA